MGKREQRRNRKKNAGYSNPLRQKNDRIQQLASSKTAKGTKRFGLKQKTKISRILAVVLIFILIPSALVFGYKKLSDVPNTPVSVKLKGFDKLKLERTAPYGGAFQTTIDSILVGPSVIGNGSISITLHGFEFEIYDCSNQCWQGWENAKNFIPGEETLKYKSQNSEILKVETSETIALFLDRTKPFRMNMDSWESVEFSLISHIRESTEGFQILATLIESSLISARGGSEFYQNRSPILSPGIFFQGIEGEKVILFIRKPDRWELNSGPFIGLEPSVDLLFVRAFSASPLPVHGPKLAFSTGYLTGPVSFPYKVEDARIQFIGKDFNFSILPKFSNVELVAASQGVHVSHPIGRVGIGGIENEISIVGELDIATTNIDLNGENFLTKASQDFNDVTIEGTSDKLIVDNKNKIQSPFQSLPNEIKAALIGLIGLILGGFFSNLEKILSWFGIFKVQK